LPAFHTENESFLPSKTKHHEENQSNNVSIWELEDGKKLRETQKKVASFEKLKTIGKLKIKKQSHGLETGEDKTFFSPQKFRVFANQKKVEYMSNTFLKLDDYNKINKEYFYGKYHSGLVVDDFSFIHPSAKFVDSKSLLIPGAYLLKIFKARTSKRKAPTFRPTDLSIIFENLAY